jgi:hypothetical protein
VEPVLIARPPGWEARLIDVLKQASVRRYDPRRWNCARFAHACAEAVSGRSIPFAYVGGSLEASADAALPRIAVRAVRRGDVVIADLPHPTLGVCVGAHVVFVVAEGLMEKPRSSVRAAWGV